MVQIFSIDPEGRSLLLAEACPKEEAEQVKINKLMD
jgi:hypothetical protein